MYVTGGGVGWVGEGANRGGYGGVSVAVTLLKNVASDPY